MGAPPVLVRLATSAAPVPPKPWYEKVKLEGTVDAYYGYRFQGAASDKTNELRVFDPLNVQICDPARPTTVVSG